MNILFNHLVLPNFTLPNILLVGIVYSAPFLIISILLPKLGEKNRAERITQEFNSFKMNNEVFSTILSKQLHYVVDKTTSSIIFGNPNATNLVTIFTNPHCEPCAKMHTRVEKLLNSGKDRFCIQYIFSAFSEDLEVSNKYMIAIFKEKTNEEMLLIYNKWFAGGKHKKEDFFKIFPSILDNQNVLEEFKKHNQWKDETKLRATPTILVNGHELPNNYKIEDLTYLLV